MTPKKHLAAADVLRVACIGLVGWYHFWQQSWLDPGFHTFGHYVNLQQMVRNGYMMVDVMLVLSGFLLALPWARARVQGFPAPLAKTFYKKRFWRIVPSYALAVLLILFLYALPQGLYDTLGKAVKDILAHAVFIHNLFPDLLSSTPLLGVLWTVAVEAQFYLIFPLLAIFYKDWPGLTCLTLALGGLLMRLWASPQSDTAFWVNQMPCMLDLFACGMAGAAIFAHRENRPIKTLTRWLLAGGAAVCFLLILQVMYTQIIGDYDLIRRYQLMWRLPLGLLTAGFLVCGCLGPACLDRIFGNRVTRVLAAISYNFYIWHQFIATRLKAWRFPPYASDNPNQAGEQPWQILYMLCCFAVSGLLATAITYLWEKPWHKWGMKKLR